MSFEPAIHAENLGKCYQLYANPQDRLKQFLWRGRRQYYREFWALHDVGFDVMPGEVVGIIGRNGSGKSTLLQLVCGTLTPTSGAVEVKGRIAALLELGAGFNPEFTGRENVFMSAAVMGLSEREIAARFDSIVAFSGIGDFIDQPVKIYSSGMYVRLAFAVAVSVDPDILIVDEALSVGDGDFARKSFDRIMELKQKGATILFCSHSLYQVEVLCDKAIWLDRGKVVQYGKPEYVIDAYQGSLRSSSVESVESTSREAVANLSASAKLVKVKVRIGKQVGQELAVVSCKDLLSIRVEYLINPQLPPPSVAISIARKGGEIVTGVGNVNDGVPMVVDKNGRGWVELVIDRIPLLKGMYFVNVVLACERAIHVYDCANNVATLLVSQEGYEQGCVHIAHAWEVGGGV